MDYNYKVGDKVLICKDGILHKAESIWKKEPWTIMTVHTNGTIRIQCGTKLERINFNIRRVTPFSEELLIYLGTIFGRDMLFDTPFVADWHTIGDYRQRQTDSSNKRENNKCVDYDYKVGDKVLICKDSILHKAESIWRKEPWTITTVHTNGTIRIQYGTKSERINIRRVTPFSEELLI